MKTKEKAYKNREINLEDLKKDYEKFKIRKRLAGQRPEAFTRK
ncbi:MAG: hypothetical protein Q4A00_05510 [Flavobacteriaceae bacterium]|nr:hypothetical protein [Flavobacteriaceae bacterium]